MDAKIITPAQAIAMLPQSEVVHTFRGGGMTLLGADWSRESIVKALNEAEQIQLSGAIATGMNHGIVIDLNGLLFIETVRELAA